VTASEDLFARARHVIPGGVNSPVRAFGSVGGTPPFIVSGTGAYLRDADGNRYVDLVQSWGASLFGHATPEIVDALPSVEMVRLVSSGTEAAMSAIRLARGFTGRSLVLKFEGCYHGHSDALLARGAGSGVATLGIPGSPGVTEGAARDTLTAPYNDLGALAEVIRERGTELAAVIVEPVAANMGVVPPEPGFLESLRDLTASVEALLIFDEVITGFRLAYGGAQLVFAIEPDLTVLGKVMGGGFPCAAFGGRLEVMEHLAPLGPVYQAGTLSGNPVAVAAGIAALDLARERDPYPEMTKTAERLSDGLAEAFGHAGLPHVVNREGSMFSVFFRGAPVRSFADATTADHSMFARFHHHMLERGVYLPPSGYELWSLCAAHGDDEVAAVLEAAAAFGG
jgi:glutamate-1-semialdehyde 2,1-aminomutase